MAELSALAALILPHLSNDPTPEDDALAHVIAGVARDLSNIAEKLKGL